MAGSLVLHVLQSLLRPSPNQEVAKLRPAHGLQALIQLVHVVIRLTHLAVQPISDMQVLLKIARVLTDSCFSALVIAIKTLIVDVHSTTCERPFNTFGPSDPLCVHNTRIVHP